MNYNDDEYVTASDIMKEAEELNNEFLKQSREELEELEEEREREEKHKIIEEMDTEKAIELINALNDSEVIIYATKEEITELFEIYDLSPSDIIDIWFTTENGQYWQNEPFVAFDGHSLAGLYLQDIKDNLYDYELSEIKEAVEEIIGAI